MSSSYKCILNKFIHLPLQNQGNKRARILIKSIKLSHGFHLNKESEPSEPPQNTRASHHRLPHPLQTHSGPCTHVWPLCLYVTLGVLLLNTLAAQYPADYGWYLNTLTSINFSAGTRCPSFHQPPLFARTFWTRYST